MLIRRCICSIDLHGRGGEGGFEIADGSVGGRSAIDRVGFLRLRRCCVQVILAGLPGVTRAHQSGGGASLLEGFGNHESDGETKKTY